jgi:hypothetical protein
MAISMVNFSDSTTQGPESKKNGLSGPTSKLHNFIGIALCNYL